MATNQEPELSAPGRRRRKAMVDAGYSLFIEKGFSTVTVDDIIRISGGSKSSFYNFFGNKEGILKAVVESLADEFMQEIRMEAVGARPIRESLRRIGLRIAELALSENAINQYRLAVANAKIQPQLSKLWYESGPRTTFVEFAEYLRKETEAGRLQVRDPERASLFFFGMLIFKDNMTMSIGAPRPALSEMKEIADEAVEVFLAAYGTTGD